MRKSMPLAAIISLIILSTGAQHVPEGIDGNGLIFKRPVGSHGQMLAIVRGPDLDKANFLFRNPDQLRLIEKMYEVRLEVHTPNMAPVVLASYVRTETTPEFDRGVEVLDAFVDDREIALCLAEGNALKIWRVSITTGSTCLSSGPSAGVWSSRAAPYKITGELVRARLSKSANAISSNGKLTLEISERSNPKHFFFEAEGFENEPSFKLVKNENAK